MAIDFSGLGGAVGDIFGGLGGFDVAKGYKAQKKGYEGAAELSRINATIADQANKIQGVKTEREIFRTLGGQQADIGAAGLKASGSALDVIRDSAQQGSLAMQLINRQGAIEQVGYQQEEQSYLAQAAAAAANAKASKKGGIGGLIKGAVGIGLALFGSDERLKEDIKLVRRREDGIGVYHFRYRGQPTLFEGVMAQDVATIRPDAVSLAEDGSLQVDYAAIGIEPKIVEEA